MKIEYTILKYLEKIKKQNPVIHNITNFVVMNSSANILLALGASPVMAHCKSEVEEMVSISNSLVLNIGTLDENWIKSMIKAAKKANQLKIPVILDVVGAGATKFRTQSVHQIMEQCKISILRGNASEILALNFSNSKTRGVDSKILVDNKTVDDMEKIAINTNCIVAVTGIKDIVTDGISTAFIYNGNPIMTKITGMGCGLSAFTGAFCAVANGKSYYDATLSAFTIYSICGEIAAEKYSHKPGSFFTKFIDTIYSIDMQKNISKLIKVSKRK